MSAIRSHLINTAYRLCPPVFWDVFSKFSGHQSAAKYKMFGNVVTRADTRPALLPKFLATYNKYSVLNQFVTDHSQLYHLYNVCAFAKLCRSVPGDFIFGGVSFGVGPRMVYDYADMANDKTMYLVDPLEGTGPGRRGEKHEGYNKDADLVLRQYPAGANVKLVREYIPDAFPLDGCDRIAFCSLNTGHPSAEAASLPLIYDLLSPGGIIILGGYSIYYDALKPTLQRMGLEPLWLPSNQGVIFKPHYAA